MCDGELSTKCKELGQAKETVTRSEICLEVMIFKMSLINKNEYNFLLFNCQCLYCLRKSKYRESESVQKIQQRVELLVFVFFEANTFNFGFFLN